MEQYNEGPIQEIQPQGMKDKLKGLTQGNDGLALLLCGFSWDAKK